MNELLFFASIVIYFSLMLLSYYLFNKVGLYVFIAIATIIANIQACKMVVLFGLNATLGNVMYSASYLATDIMSENEGENEAKKTVFIGFFTQILFVIATFLTLCFVPSENDIINGAMTELFTFVPRLCFAGIITYAISQFFDIWLFSKLRQKTKGKHLWLRNNVATVTAQAIDTIVFTFIAFSFIYSIGLIIELILVTYLIKVIISVCDTPFIYLAKKIKGKSLFLDKKF